MPMDLQKRVEDMREFFNEKAPNNNFDEVHGKLMNSKKVLIDALPEGTKKVLDLGAGTGLELIYLYERFPDAAVTAVDVSEKMLDVLKMRDFADKVTVICGDFFAEDFGSGYDAVISSSALHHFEEEPKAELYKKCFASLRAGGAFVNSDCCYDTVEEQEARFHEFFTNGHNYRHCDTPLAAQNEEKLLTAAGFVNVSSEKETDEGYYLIRGTKPE